jgi:UDP-glucose 4-epimerase
MAILVTGGAGYIGSVMVDLLVEKGERAVVLDDLSRGHRGAVAEGVPFFEGSIGDRALVARICDEHDVDACVHFAALAYVGESVAEPKRYFENNVGQGLVLLDALLAAGVRHMVFSSTCATYGEPVRVPIDESHPQQPTNPYGWSKLFMEKILASYDAAYGLKYVALRYFNASGAAGRCGEHHEPETHLIPNVLFAATGRLSHVAVFGGEYPTPDGTAVRDYIHVTDLCTAHVLALEHLRAGGGSECINLGTGHGFSVMEVIEAARRVTGLEIEARVEPARPGDPSRLVAAADKARAVLGWEPRFTDLDTIIRTAWDWHHAHPDGYGAE